MKRSMQKAWSRDRKRRLQKEESLSKTQNIPVNPPQMKLNGTIDDCLAELESSILSPSTDTGTTADTKPSSPDTNQHEQQQTLQPHLNSTLIRDKIELWNQIFHRWKDQHKPPPAELLPNFDLEMTRHFKLQELSTYFLEASLVTDSSGVKQTGLKMPSFERWLLDAKLEDHNASIDPILPKHAHIDMEASQRLLEELLSNGIVSDRKAAKKLVQKFCARCNQTYNFLQKQQHTKRSYLWKKGDQVDVEFPEDSSSVTLVYRRPKQWKKPFCIKVNRSHFDKLKDLFYKTHQMKASSQTDTIFHLLLMMVLLRYSSLSGGHLLQELRGGGMQGAVHEGVFDVLQSSECFVLEGFGSPLNCCLRSFGSAFFHDLDWHFGSIGNFFQLPFAQEAACHNHGLIVQANPPFSPGLMQTMTEHIIQQIDLANEAKVPLAFVVIVPSPGDFNDPDRAVAKRYGGEAIRPLLDDTDPAYHFILKSKEHGYIEGAQHLRPTRYKESLYDTSVIVVTSKAAKLDMGELEPKLRGAFQSQHRAETKARRSIEHHDDDDIAEG